MPVVRCRPEVFVKHHRLRRLVVDATTLHDKTTTKLVTIYPDGSVRSERLSGFEPVAGCFYNGAVATTTIKQQLQLISNYN